MSNLRLALVSIAAVLLVGCGSGAATTAPGTAVNTDKTLTAPSKNGAPGAPVKVSSAMLGPGAADAENRVGSKAK